MTRQYFTGKSFTLNRAKPKRQAYGHIPTGPGVYVLRWQGFIKIGHAANIRVRYRGILDAFPPTSCPPLLWCTAQGASRQFERTLHEQFAKDRVKGEWFQDSPALLSDLEQAVQDWNRYVLGRDTCK